MIDNPAWNRVREYLAGERGPEYETVESDFAEIEREVEKLVRDYNGNIAAERELRNALEADTAPGAQIQRRGG